MAKEIDEIKKAAGDYQKWALAARKQYINLRLRQDKEIANLYIRSADRIAKELQQIGTTTISGQIRKKHFKELEKSLRAEAELIQKGLTEAFVDYIDSAVKAGVGYTQGVVLNLFDQAGLKTSGIRKLFSRVNKQAVEAIWARTRNGLYLSDRIWEQSEKSRTIMRDLIQESVAIGQDAVKTARMLQQYVREGAMTLAKRYPNMMKRMKGRIPGNISYEALRLARTEMTAAFGEGTIAAARVAPSYLGMKWVLSKSHPIADICDTLSTYDSGLGPGVYPQGDEPPYPAHPNCLCALVPIHEEPEEFVAKLKNWLEDPENEPELEQWYQNIYKQGEGKAKLPKASQEAAESVAKTAAEAMEKIEEEEEDIINLDEFEDLYEKYQPEDFGVNNTIEDVKSHSHLLKYEATEDELQVVKYYTGDKGCQEFNQALRFPEIGEEVSESTKKGIQTLTNLIKKANPLSQNTIFYRHTRLDVLEYIYNPEVREIAREVVENGDTSKMPELKKLLIDSTIQDKGFLSTSYHPGVFTEVDGLEIRIHAPKGFRGGLFLEEISRFKSEREYLFAPGQKFKVLDVDVGKVYPGVKTNLILHAVPVE
jgi:hypothetical protein